MAENSNTPPSQPQDPLASAKLSRYKPIDGPSNRQLRFGLWWLEHSAIVRRSIMVILLLVALAIWVPAGYQWGRYIYDGYFADRSVAQSLVVADPLNHAALAAQGPLELIVGEARVLPALPGGYEVASMVRNPNRLWYAHFEYAFVRGGNTDDARWHDGYALPGQDMQLVDFISDTGARLNVELRVRNVSWRRLSTDQARLLVLDQEDLRVENIAVSLGVGGTASLHRVSFTAINNTPYNFWEAEFTLEARSGSRLVGITKYVATEFAAGSSRDITVVWPGNWGGARVTVTASADMVHERNLQKFDLGPAQVK